MFSEDRRDREKWEEKIGHEERGKVPCDVSIEALNESTELSKREEDDLCSTLSSMEDFEGEVRSLFDASYEEELT